MQRKLLPLLRCPDCNAPVALEEATPMTGDRIETGTLVCTQNGQRYAIKGGMPYLYVDDERWQPKAREAEGWVQWHKDHNMYDQTGVDIDFRSPYHDVDPWREVASQFDIALERAKPEPGERVLDLGAGRGWAAKHLALRGCQTVAVEIVDDDQVGLGRSRALMQQAGIVYDIMIADSENLPFADESFDMVFGAAVLHHTTNLDLLLHNIGRVLRRGGRLVAINEPCIHDASDDEELRRTVLAEELAYGINETRPRLDDYRRALTQAGLQEQDLFAFHAYGLSIASLAAWSHELGILPPAALIQPEDIALYTTSASSQPWQAPRIWMDYLLRQRGGTLILIATKA